ncbi:ABC-type transport system involved in multi-copper enzyme maturation permease subunit [Actinoalloteichus hoggarensis]|uniref:ABC-2 family transporter protein n=1 Tax=Actinoalloteichus hoggarensis TaxID=1470176 RepID=A0A221W4U0_9PSEU|nr:hypothetical protein [Actinoalloteichus hoggarensis]ASO20784.1 ABC-2 family transporter protein [Actinoalloteichus hoggarensis]MBB5920714.1 ABC-type transport system involved in multi-copper enzyme maturation permease subunit [Actinoalloteichus hoggarensis]
MTAAPDTATRAGRHAAASPADTAASHPGTGPTDRAVGAARVTLRRVIHSEWIKLFTLRSTVIALLAAIVALVGLGVLFAATSTGQIAPGGPDGGGPPVAGLDPATLSLSGVLLVQLITGSLGVLAMAGEYSTGMIRSSLIGVPRRLPVLWAKTLVFGGVVFVAMLAASGTAFLAGQAVLAAGDAASLTLSDDGVPRAVVGAAAQVTGVGLLGLALGGLLRNTSAAISTLVGVILVLPGLITLLGADIAENVSPYLPSNAAAALRSVVESPELLPPGQGLAVFGGYIVLALIAAAVLLRRRDV